MILPIDCSNRRISGNVFGCVFSVQIERRILPSTHVEFFLILKSLNLILNCDFIFLMLCFFVFCWNKRLKLGNYLLSNLQGLPRFIGWFPYIFGFFPSFLVLSNDFFPFPISFWSNCINIQSENTNKLWERTKNLWDMIKKSWECTKKT